MVSDGGRRFGYTPAVPRTLIVRIVFLFLVLSCAACVTTPSMSLYGARVTHTTPAGVGMTMTMKVQNDNVFDIQLRGVMANVTLAKRYQLPPVVANPWLWLPAGRATLVHVPVIIPWTLIGPLIQTTLGSSLVSYRVVGRADVTATRALEIDFDDYKLDQEGRFSRGELLMAAGRGILGAAPVPATEDLEAEVVVALVAP